MKIATGGVLVAGLVWAGSAMAADPLDLSDSSVAPGTTITDIQVLSTNQVVRLTPYAQDPTNTGYGFTTDMQVDALGRTLLTSLGGDIQLIGADGVLRSQSWLQTESTSGLKSNAFYDYGLTALALHPDFLNVGTAGYGKFYTVEANDNIQNPNLNDFTHPFGGVDERGTPITRGPHSSRVVEYTTNTPAAEMLTLGVDTTRRVVIDFHQESHSHNVGDLAFDRDGLLYIGVGDGGNGTGFELNSNSVDNPYGSILRIDPLTLEDTTDRKVFAPGGVGDERFSVPTDNPHYDGGTIGSEDMVFITGARNPYRINFDFGDDGNGDDLWFSETGQNNAESIKKFSVSEVISKQSSGDAGWGLLEGSFIYLGNHSASSESNRGDPDVGTASFAPTSVAQVLSDYDADNNPNPEVQFITHPDSGKARRDSGTTRNTAVIRELTDEEVERLLAIVNGPVNDLPIFEYDHTDGVSPIGGFIYRGTELQSELEGSYIFADYQGAENPQRDEDGRTVGEGARLLYGDPSGPIGSALVYQMLIDSEGEELPFRITGFGQDANGELVLYGVDENFQGMLLSITAVPEPSIAALLIAPLLLASRRRR